jgi:hypothetical protein
MLKEDEQRFFEYYRMMPATFCYLLNKIESDVTRNRKHSISPEEKLAVTLR